MLEKIDVFSYFRPEERNIHEAVGWRVFFKLICLIRTLGAINANIGGEGELTTYLHKGRDFSYRTPNTQ